jgi:rubrerythrin
MRREEQAMAAADDVNRLVTLMQLDRDAVRAYEEAIAAIDIPEIRDRLEEFREDHEHHVEALEAAIGRLGGTPPEPAPDAMGYVIEGYTAIRAAMGIAGALRAMKSNEALTTAAYEAALALELPADVKRMVERHRDDERRHLAYIEAVLEDRVWQLDPAPGRHGWLGADLGTLVPLALGGALVANAFWQRSAASLFGGAIGAALLVAAMQSGVNPGGLIPAHSLARGGDGQGAAAQG